MLSWIALTLTLTSAFLVILRLVRRRSNGVALLPLLVAQPLLLVDDIRKGDGIGIGLVALTLVACAFWAQALRVARRRRSA